MSIQNLSQANEFVQLLLQVSGKDKIDGMLLEKIKVIRIDPKNAEIELQVT
jgi:hypothetical protein